MRTGSFSAAARELNVTHAAIAQHVRSLEAHLGHPLLIREGRQMVPTPEGAQLAAHLQDGFEQIIKGVHALTADMRNKPVQITLTPNIAENWLMPRLTTFWANHPDIKLSIMPSNDVIDLRRDGFDLAIRYGAGDWPGTDSAFLIRGDYVVAVHRDLLRGRIPEGIEDLHDVPWLFCPSLPVYRAWAINSGLDPDRIKEHQFPSMNMVSTAVRAGVGASVMIKAMVADDIAEGRLIVVGPSFTPGLGYYVVTPKGVMPPKVKTLRRWLLNQADQP